MNFLSERRSFVGEIPKDELARWVDPDPHGIKLNPMDHLLTEIVEKILSYLNVVDLLDASLASHEWYALIANSVLCMRKVQLKLDRDAPEDFDISKNSIRKYQTASGHNNKSEMFASTVNFITTANNRWKCIDLSHIVFESKEQYENFLRVIAPTIEKLVLVRLSIEDCDDESVCDVEFPYLKELEVKNCHAFINKSFGNVPNLTYLHINHGTDRSAAEVIRKMLRSCEHLKNLSMGGNIFCEVFEDLANDIPFRLTLLSAHRFEKPPEYSNVKTNFNKFLTVHRPSLSCVYLDADLGRAVRDNIFHIMNVDTVTLMN
ncbi:unnamed protein product [Diamesa tonsa]